MNGQNRVLSWIGIAAGWLLAAGMVTATARGEPAPTVVELFTSQSCYSCPPAEALLGEMAARRDLVALEFHVDYWDDLVYGLAGRWKDVHSDPAYTLRQRAYATRLPGGVYTPQLVVDGRTQAVGSRPSEVSAAIAEARKVPRLAVNLTTRDAGKTELRIVGGEMPAEGSAEVWLVQFKTKETTKVRAGENRGKTLVNHHIVTGLAALGPLVLDGGSMVFNSGAPVLNEGCAVLIQARAGSSLGPILGAAYCPKSS